LISGSGLLFLVLATSSRICSTKREENNLTASTTAMYEGHPESKDRLAIKKNKQNKN
jgi:hypothetical protein